MVVLILSAVLFALAVVLLGIGAAGLGGRLARNRWAGVRTPAALASDAAFRLANRAAAPAVLAAGTLLAVGGAATVGFGGPLRVVTVGLSVLGALGLVLAGGAVGATAAELTPTPPPAGATRCATCPGCDLLGAAGSTARAPAAVTNPSCPAHP